MNEQLPPIDPSIFEEGMDLELSMAVTTQVDIFVKANDVIERYSKKSGQPSPDTLLGDVLGNTLERYALETGSGISLDIGEVTVTAIGDTSGEPITVSLQDIADDQYEQALIDKDESSGYLVGYVQGLQVYVSKNLEGIYERALIPEKSWELTWKKTRDIVRSMGGGSLADIADFFDGLVELQYPSTFDRTKRTRSDEVSQDISARMFYVVMEPHLKRATMRQGEDGWSG